MRIRDLAEHRSALGFTPQPAMRWLSPSQIVRTALEVLLSSNLVGFLDKRELQDGLPSQAIQLSPDNAGELWFDYLADTGDGFDATYTVANLVAADQLQVEGVALDDSLSGQDLALPRGRALILGGDQIYPTPSAQGYENRFRGPFRLALPEAEPRPLMVALPGNHDWYDGLTAFLRVFTQSRRIGGWQTEQSRSYFVIELPGRWWMVGLDTQLGAEIDEPQYRYFIEHLSRNLQPGDSVILCVASPHWIRLKDDPQIFDTYAWFDQKLVRNRPVGQFGEEEVTGARVRLWLTGDRHHYAHYEPEDSNDAHFVTCGLGGAYTAETHTLPEDVDIPKRPTTSGETDTTRHRLGTRFPSKKLSQQLHWGSLSWGPFGLPRRNPGFWRLAGAVNGFLFVVWAAFLGLITELPPVTAIREAASYDLGRLIWHAVIWLLVLWAVTVMRWPWRRMGKFGVLAGNSGIRGLVTVIVTSLAVVSAGGLVVATLIPWPASWPDSAVLLISIVSAGIIAGFVTSYVMAIGVILSPNPVVREIAMSAQALEDYKGFLRMKISADGRLTIYPIAVSKACHEWVLEDVAGFLHGMKRPVPAPGARWSTPHLLEAPIVIEPAASS